MTGRIIGSGLVQAANELVEGEQPSTTAVAMAGLLSSREAAAQVGATAAAAATAAAIAVAPASLRCLSPRCGDVAAALAHLATGGAPQPPLLVHAATPAPSAAGCAPAEVAKSNDGHAASATASAAGGYRQLQPGSALLLHGTPAASSSGGRIATLEASTDGAAGSDCGDGVPHRAAALPHASLQSSFIMASVCGTGTTSPGCVLHCAHLAGAAVPSASVPGTPQVSAAGQGPADTVDSEQHGKLAEPLVAPKHVATGHPRHQQQQQQQQQQQTQQQTQHAQQQQLAPHLPRAPAPRAKQELSSLYGLALASAVCMADLVRQVEVACAERGHALACAWNASVGAAEAALGELRASNAQLLRLNADLTSQQEEMAKDMRGVDFLRCVGLMRVALHQVCCACNAGHSLLQAADEMASASNCPCLELQMYCTVLRCTPPATGVRLCVSGMSLKRQPQL
jgi:hypothetical protein